MKEIIYNKARTACVTGHRLLDENFNKNRLKEVFNSLISIGYDTFIVGMALGFDTLCFNLLEEIRKEKEIKIISAVPCKTQDYKYTFEQKKEYDRMISVADEVVLVSEVYNSRCMQKRNEYMVDNSSVIIAYLRRNYGGTYNTVKYAEKKGVSIISV